MLRRRDSSTCAVTAVGSNAAPKEPITALPPATFSTPATCSSHPSPCTRPVSLTRSEEHTSELQSRLHLVCRLLLEKKKHHDTSLTTTLLARPRQCAAYST